jgi:hypothetical protein
MGPCPVARSDTELHPVPLAAGVILAKRAEPEGTPQDSLRGSVVALQLVISSCLWFDLVAGFPLSPGGGCR